MIGKELPPMKLLRQMKYRYPGIFDTIDSLHGDERYKNLWPHEAAWTISQAVLSAMVAVSGKKPEEMDQEMAADMEAVQALAGWRQGKTVYDFSPALTEELYRGAAEKKLTLAADMLRLPAYTVYIQPNFREAEDEADQGCGFFVSWNYTPAPELCFVSVDSRGKADLEYRLLIGEEEETLEACMDRTAASFRESLEKARSMRAIQESIGDEEVDLTGTLRSFRRIVSKWLALVLYLSAVNAEIRRDPAHDFRRTRKVRDIPREIDHLLVGEETGIRLTEFRRRAGNARGEDRGGHHRSPVMHLRRAHWHTYLRGPRKLGPKRQRFLKWIAPIMVGGEGKTSEVVTVAKVRK